MGKIDPTRVTSEAAPAHRPPAGLVLGLELTRAMVAIGMNVAAEPAPDANIEDTLYYASVEGVERDGEPFRIGAVARVHRQQ